MELLAKETVIFVLDTMEKENNDNRQDGGDQVADTIDGVIGIIREAIETMPTLVIGRKGEK